MLLLHELLWERELRQVARSVGGAILHHHAALLQVGEQLLIGLSGVWLHATIYSHLAECALHERSLCLLLLDHLRRVGTSLIITVRAWQGQPVMFTLLLRIVALLAVHGDAEVLNVDLGLEHSLHLLLNLLLEVQIFEQLRVRCAAVVHAASVHHSQLMLLSLRELLAEQLLQSLLRDSCLAVRSSLRLLRHVVHLLLKELLLLLIEHLLLGHGRHTHLALTRLLREQLRREVHAVELRLLALRLVVVHLLRGTLINVRGRLLLLHVMRLSVCRQRLLLLVFLLFLFALLFLLVCRLLILKLLFFLGLRSRRVLAGRLSAQDLWHLRYR